jgi:putative N6-adenine-specific DNA methylase
VKKRIADTVSDGFLAWRRQAAPQEGPPAKAGQTQSVFVRFLDDVCTMSLDTSGEHLHKRGYRNDTPEAPLRETLAAGLLLRLFEGAGDGETRWNLVDPMAGSGTFLFEALGLARPLPRPFAFENFACVREGRVRVENDWPRPTGLPKFERVLGFDASEDSLRAARANAERIGARAFTEAHAEFTKQNVFETVPAGISGDTAVICNPPYGERLRIEGPLTKYYSELLASVERGFKPRRAGFVFPAKADPKRIQLPRGWRRDSVLRFSNGGLPVVFDVFVTD